MLKLLEQVKEQGVIFVWYDAKQVASCSSGTLPGRVLS